MSPSVASRCITVGFAAAFFTAIALQGGFNGDLESLASVAVVFGGVLLPVALPGVLAAKSPGRWGWVHVAMQVVAVLAIAYPFWAHQAHPGKDQGIFFPFWLGGLLILAAVVWLVQSHVTQR